MTAQNTAGNASQSETDPSPRPPFLRRLFSAQVLRRPLFLAACLATLIGVFYAEENWRGKQAWERCRRDLEAKGASLDWNNYIPAPIPDEQNIFKAQKIEEWFVKGKSDTDGRHLLEQRRPLPAGQTTGTGFVTIAELRIVPPGTEWDSNSVDGSFRFNDPAASREARKLARKAIGPAIMGARGFTFLARPASDIRPVRVIVEAGTVPPRAQLASLFAINDLLSAKAGLRVESSGTNVFHVAVSFPEDCFTAAEYLAWSEQFEPDFDLVRAALKRPSARMDGDYRQPFAVPIPNFVAVRHVVQTLAERAQCYLLLGEPEQALNELTLLHDMCRLLEGAPSSKPMTLVATMINAAVTGLHTDVVADGLRLRAWRAPELAALQEQLNEISLMPYLVESFAAERAGLCRTFEMTRTEGLNMIFRFGVENPTLWDRIKNPTVILLRLVPRGWVYQNMATVASLHQTMIETLDATNQIVRPGETENVLRGTQVAFRRSSPYTFLAAVAVPNFTKATRTLAQKQTLAHQALVACALERCRLAHGQYPENLQALVPEFTNKLPHDIIKGGALRYRLTPAGEFVLYSVGWNEKDDGGVVEKDPSEGDWVWRGGE